MIHLICSKYRTCSVVYAEQNGIETIITHKLLVHFINSFKEFQRLELNMQFQSGQTEIVFSHETYSNNICFIYNFDNQCS